MVRGFGGRVRPGISERIGGRYWTMKDISGSIEWNPSFSKVIRDCNEIDTSLTDIHSSFFISKRANEVEY